VVSIGVGILLAFRAGVFLSGYVLRILVFRAGVIDIGVLNWFMFDPACFIGVDG
jgi:hypothetical protein